jgi:hypothetical protein
MCNKNVLTRNFYKLTASAAIAVALMHPCQSFAALWQFTPKVTLEERYDDNIRLTTGQHDSVTGTLLKGHLGFDRLTETSAVKGKLFVNLSDYTGDEVKSNNNNIFLNVDSFTRTELTTFGLNGVYRRDTTTRSVDTLDLDTDLVIDDVDEGLVDIDVRRNYLRLNPSVQHNISERTSLLLAYNYTDVSYKNNPVGSNLFDYDHHSVTGGFSRKLTERDTLRAYLSVSRFNSPDNNDIEIDSYEVTAGYKRQFSENTNGEVRVGVSYAERESNVLSLDDTGYVIKLALNHKTETDRYALDIKRDLQPSGSGSLVEANSLSLTMRRMLSRTLIASMLLRYQDNTRLISNESNQYLLITPRLKWKLTRWWTLGTGYTYRKKERDPGGNDADSNAVFISLGYGKPVTLE